MLNRKQFEININMLLTMKDIDFNAGKSDCLYRIMANDFTDKEFANACLDIAKTECLYNKYPDPKLFYDRRKTLKPDEEKNLIKQQFLEKVSDYIQEDMPSYLNQSYSPGEMRILQMCGGLSQLWSDIHNNNGKVSYLIAQVAKNFDNFYEVEKKTNDTIQLENHTEQAQVIINQVKLLSDSKKSS